MESVPDEQWRAEQWNVSLYQVEPYVSNRGVGKPAYLFKSFDKFSLEEIKRKYCLKPGSYVFEYWLKKHTELIFKATFYVLSTEAEALETAQKPSQDVVTTLVNKLTDMKSGGADLNLNTVVQKCVEMLSTTYGMGLKQIQEQSSPSGALAIVREVLAATGGQKQTLDDQLLTRLIDRAFKDQKPERSSIEETLLGRIIDRAFPESGNPADPMTQANAAIDLVDKIKERVGGEGGGGGGRQSGWAAFFTSIAPHIGPLFQAALMFGQAYVMKTRAETAALTGLRGQPPPGQPGLTAPGSPWPPQWAPAGAGRPPGNNQPGGPSNAPPNASMPANGIAPAASGPAFGPMDGPLPAFEPGASFPDASFPNPDPRVPSPDFQGMLQQQLQELFLMIARMYENGREGEFVAAMIQEMAAPGGHLSQGAGIVLEQIRGLDEAKLTEQVRLTPVISVLAEDTEWPKFAHSMADYFKRDEIDSKGAAGAASETQQ
jgi:hypothetical protein